jgi:hypothetical protein
MDLRTWALAVDIKNLYRLKQRNILLRDQQFNGKHTQSPLIHLKKQDFAEHTKAVDRLFFLEEGLVSFQGFDVLFIKA